MLRMAAELGITFWMLLYGYYANIYRPEWPRKPLSVKNSGFLERKFVSLKVR